MVAPVVRLGEPALAVHRAAEFAAPDNQRVVQQTALLQILNQAQPRLVSVCALRRNLFRQIRVLIPAAVEQLDEPHSALRKPPSQQAIGGEGSRLPRIRTVELEVMLGLF